MLFFATSFLFRPHVSLRTRLGNLVRGSSFCNQRARISSLPFDANLQKSLRTALAKSAHAGYAHDAKKSQNFPPLRSTVTTGCHITNTSEWISIQSKPIDTFYEPMCVEMKLPAEMLSRLRSRGKPLKWSVDFEIDVAYMQRRLNLCILPIELLGEVERIDITADMWSSMIEESKITVHDLCNFNALHLALEVDGMTEVDSSIAIEVGHDGFQESENIGQLIRKIYTF